MPLASRSHSETISDFIKGEPGTQAQIRQNSPGNLAVSVVTVMELCDGLLLNARLAQKVAPAIASLLSAITILPFSTTEAEQAAQIRSILRSQGHPIGGV